MEDETKQPAATPVTEPLPPIDIVPSTTSAVTDINAPVPAITPQPVVPIINAPTVPASPVTPLEPTANIPIPTMSPAPEQPAAAAVAPIVPPAIPPGAVPTVPPVSAIPQPVATPPVTPVAQTVPTLADIQAGAAAITAATPAVPVETAPIVERTVLAHTYEDDLSRAMNVSDAVVVQELLTSARERETVMKEEVHKRKARGWYTTASIILILCAAAAAAYSAYHYMRLTVPVQEGVSIGVFPSTEPVVARTTTVENLIAGFTTDNTLTEAKPYLVDLVKDEQTQILLSNTELFSFIGASPTEPFATSLAVIRLGVMDTGADTVPFLIASIPNPEIAAKEFLIAEPTLLEMFHTALGIDTTTIVPIADPAFVGEYRYNLPVRALYGTNQTGLRSLTMLYGFATDNIVVFTTKPEVLKAVYDTVIRQQ